jgi:ribonuclease R
VSDSAALSERISDLLSRKGNRLLGVREIHQRLAESGLPNLSRDDVEAAVEEMERDGRLVAVRGKRYSLLEFSPYESGTIRIHSDGDGVVRTGRADAPDIIVNRRSLRGAMNDDLVLVRYDKRSPRDREYKGRRYVEGEVVRVLRRAHATVVGRLHRVDPPFVRPFDTRLDEDILIRPDSLGEARDGEMVNVEIDVYPSQSMDAFGRIVEILGMIGEPGVDIEVVIRKYKIPHQFPDEVLAAAEAIPTEIDPGEIAGRTDLRDHTIVTIDGETAKDFDDAVEVIRLPNGNYSLGVHIADVSHYVTEGSILDREAFERGTSVYFPGRAVPMLPERLSNGICSLNPQVDRLTFTAKMEIDRKGRVVDRTFFRSVIRTRARMTYTEVNALLTEPDPELLSRYDALMPAFRLMEELYHILRERRTARGSIDFDLPEADVLLGEEGEIESILPTERNIAHRLIEEFMLAANEAVATQLVMSDQPGLYRVHQAPDAQKLEDLRGILKEFKHSLRGDLEEIRPGELQRVLREVAGTPEERFLTEVILRSMKRAFYLEESAGHFALALQHYCHFTSPIRRYPDLIVHRRLAELLESGALIGDRRAEIEGRHPGLALQSSERERRAEEAEREVLEWKKVIFMRDKVGEEYSGRVTGVVPFGLFVELDEYFVQGLVPVAKIGGDSWKYFEREHRLRGEESAREFRLGDPVKVIIEEVNEDRRQIEFRLVEAGGEPIAARVREGASRGR